MVPESKYVVSMYLATGGASGHLLGSDEKEIIYLVFGIIDFQNKEVSDSNLSAMCTYIRKSRVPLNFKFLKNVFYPIVCCDGRRKKKEKKKI